METRSLERIVFGKLVGPDGAIRRGLDYQVTGCSKSFPEDLRAECHPAHLGLGIEGDAFRWEEYPWFDTGGVVGRPVFTSRPPAAYVVVGRVRPRSEAGDGREYRAKGRVYYQTEYAAVPVGDWRYWLPSALGRKLDARAMPELEELAPIEVEWDSEGELLPSGWIQTVRPHLERLLSGLPVEAVDSNCPVQEFLDLVTCCQVALPGALTWRLSFGAGLHRRPRSIRVALTQMAGEMPSGSASQGSVRPHAEYLNWLERVCRSARTFGQVAETVFDRFERMKAGPEIAGDEAWRSAVVNVMDELKKPYPPPGTF
jgi:hypothetical protein